MSDNTAVSMTGLDFVDIKNNLTTFMQNQDVFKDYNFAGSGLSVLLDVLAFNTQYNAYYLNMVANEMFLDTALQRSSVVSQSKLLGYTPRSSIAPTASIKLVVNQVTETSLTLPQHTQFISRAIDGVNYTFVTDDALTVNTVNGSATFNNVIIKQGIPSTFSFVVNSTSNPNYTFEIPDVNVDTSTLTVSVQKSSSNTAQQHFNIASDYITLDGNSAVYFLQEGISGNYEIYFGDGILGMKLTDGNIINVGFVTTSGTKAQGANNFTLMQRVGVYGNTSVFPITSAANGLSKESITSIKYQAPKSFAAQGRAVTKDDYITAIQQNTLGISFDAVNVWGGEENEVPVYGQVFISLKPSGSYYITQTQKQMLISHVINPISIMTVSPNIIDPDYTHIILNIDVLYDKTKTIKTASQLNIDCATSALNYSANTLNTFNASFNNYGFLSNIMSVDESIISDDIKLQLQKRIYPDFTSSKNYTLSYDTPLNKGIMTSGVSSSPSMSFIDPINSFDILSGVYIEEMPTTSNGVDAISIINPGTQYSYPPTVTILGDGVGATAHAVLSLSGGIQSIVIDKPGTGYTSAIVKFTNADVDNTGKLASGIVVLQGSIGILRTYYSNKQQIKTILNPNIGTIDYVKGIIHLTDFNPIGVDDVFGRLSINVNPSSNIISSTFNRILTLDPFDPAAISVNIKTST